MSEKEIKELLEKRETINLEIYGNGVYDNNVNRSDLWITNHSLIMIFINHHVENHLYFPQVSAIAKGTGLSRPTVYRHIKQIDTVEYKEFEKGQLKAMASNILLQVYKEANNMVMNPQALRAAKIFLDHVSKIDNPQKSNSITINNITINQNAIMGLPEATRKEIERLILKDTITLPLHNLKNTKNGTLEIE